MKRDKRVLIILFLLSVLFLILGISLEKKVYENKTYTDRNEVALYLMKYHKLPSNYLTKEEADARYDSRKDAIIDGYAIGGDIFEYKGEIIEYTNNQDLREADYYPDLEYAKKNGRGLYRIVYTASGKFELFCTESHYNQKHENNFYKLTEFEIQLPSFIMWCCFIQTAGGMVVFIGAHQITLNRRKKDE